MLHRWKSCLRAIAPLNHLHPLNSRYYPLSQWEQHQHWWKRFIQRLVKQQHANTLSLLQAYQAELLAGLDEGGGIAFSATEDTFSWLGMAWDSTSMQARMSPAREESILSAMKSIRLGQSLPVKQFQRLLGLMAATSKVIPFGLLYMRPLQWWLRTKGFSPRGNPFRFIKVMRLCLHALVMWNKPWFLSQGPVLGASCLHDANDRCLSHGLGSDLRVTRKSGSVEGPSSLMAHQPSGDVSYISCSQEFPSRSQGPPCARPLRQHISGLLHKSPGGFEVTSSLKTGVSNPPVVPREVVVSSSSLHPGGPQYRRKHPVETGAEAQGMEAPPRCGARLCCKHSILLRMRTRKGTICFAQCGH